MLKFPKSYLEIQGLEKFFTAAAGALAMLKGIRASAKSVTSLRSAAAMRGDIGPQTLTGNDSTTGRLAGAAGFESVETGFAVEACIQYQLAVEFPLQEMGNGGT